MDNRRPRKGEKEMPHFQHLNPYAAGIDVGSRSHFVAVPEAADEKPVREFSCFTGDLHRLADWLHTCGIKTVAMESTGIYWIPVFEILEHRGFAVKLVNAHHVKNVPGRKTDVSDCQWLQRLHSYGLLEGAFRPPDQVCVLRSYIGQRMNLVQYAAAHIQHMQKALGQMNLLLHNVVTDVTGVTGTLAHGKGVVDTPLAPLWWGITSPCAPPSGRLLPLFFVKIGSRRLPPRGIQHGK